MWLLQCLLIRLGSAAVYLVAAASLPRRYSHAVTAAEDAAAAAAEREKLSPSPATFAAAAATATAAAAALASAATVAVPSALPLGASGHCRRGGAHGFGAYGFGRARGQPPQR